MQAEGGLYIVCTRLAPTDLSLVGWVRLRGCIIGIRKCLHPRQGALCFGQARTQPNRAVRSAHQAFVPRHGSCEPRKVDNGELSRINPSRQIVPGPTRNIHPVSTRQSCRDGQGTAVLQNNKAAEKVRPALPRGSTPASTASNFSQPATQHHSTPTTPARYTYRPLREASHQANSPRGKPIAAPRLVSIGSTPPHRHTYTTEAAPSSAPLRLVEPLRLCLHTAIARPTATLFLSQRKNAGAMAQKHFQNSANIVL
jgi:hypothetical protein